MSRGDDRVFLTTRLVAGAVFVILCFAVVTLLGFPGRTADLFAWKIKAQMTSIELGSGYAAGAYFFARAAFARRWHSVSVGFLPIAAFASLMEIATIIHWDIFIHGRFPFHFWIVVYSITPWLVPLVWLLNRQADPGTPSEDDAIIPPLGRRAFAAWGTLMVTMGAFLYLWPAKAADVWPWPLTPLTSRVLGAWFVMGTAGFLLARDARWSSARVTTHAMIAATLLVLVGVGRTWDEFDASRPFTYVFLVFLGLALFFFIWLQLTMERAARGGVARPLATENRSGQRR